jgi:hypothetical protein
MQRCSCRRMLLGSKKSSTIAAIHPLLLLLLLQVGGLKGGVPTRNVKPIEFFYHSTTSIYTDAASGFSIKYENGLEGSYATPNLITPGAEIVFQRTRFTINCPTTLRTCSLPLPSVLVAVLRCMKCSPTSERLSVLCWLR